MSEYESPPSTWIGSTWISGEGRMYSVEDMRTLFGAECTLFVGDSLQRRAGDTLYDILSSNDSHDINETAFDGMNQKYKDRGRKERVLEGGGCLDFEWRPTLPDMVNFTVDYDLQPELYGKYTLVVAGSVIWDSCRQSRLKASQVENRTSLAIDALAETLVPKNVSWIWKTGGWCHNCRDATNAKVAAGNNMAMSKIQQMHRQQPSTKNQITYVDWGKHVHARSILDSRILSGDNNPYHYGLEPRLVLLQMLSSALHRRRPDLLSPRGVGAPDEYDLSSLVDSTDEDDIFTYSSSTVETNSLGALQCVTLVVAILMLLCRFKRLTAPPNKSR